ncbi:hypothetical protein AK830_g5588 [Neonectria ditissima]|uniref:Centromere protein H C-terminal domain-containing protein n=1 Tax=Neonectria ditissima TaxID=78410 RepID=A0A0P7BE26_9HYPO|nr:hypothetical protein AK830_g5588 [Neonectria ditissima]
MEVSADQPMGNTLEQASHLPLSADEEKALALYDRLQELRLEIAVINAQRSHQTDEPANFTQEEAQKAQEELLESRAKFVLRNDVIEAVLMANPILKAVHNGTDASSVDRDLLPCVEQRDEAAISVAKQAAASGKQWSELTAVQSETLRVSRQNVESTAELLKLAEEVKKKTGMNGNPEVRQEQETLEAKVKESRQRWRVMKGVASGVVVGSGVDWAQDDELLETILDPETEE